MTDLLTQWAQRPDLLIYLCVAGAVIITVEAIGLMLGRRRSSRKTINKRLHLLNINNSREAVLVELRRDRGLTGDGTFSFSLTSINRLILQSGVGVRSPLLVGLVVGGALVGGLLTALAFNEPLMAVPVGCLTGLAVPLVALWVMRNRRQAKFGEQFPEALDILVRSMRAGHPVSVAVSLVAREMPDPVGTEFGMTADEMTFGLDLDTALQNLSGRVGQIDLPFLVVAVSIQTRTGGNLAEVLANLSRIIRDRFKLRRRVKAMSAEGRLSAAALSLIPLFVFLAISLLSPNFYGGIKGDPVVAPIATFTLTLWATGIFVIYRLVNFKY